VLSDVQKWFEGKAIEDATLKWEYTCHADGTLRGLFWTTEHQLDLFRRHGDVLALDATYCVDTFAVFFVCLPLLKHLENRISS
jgi:hypothetical protein